MRHAITVAVGAARAEAATVPTPGRTYRDDVEVPDRSSRLVLTPAGAALWVVTT